MSEHYDDITAICDALRVRLGDPERFNFVAIRLMLRTGVDIKAPREHHRHHARTIRRVLAALSAMGFNLEESRRVS